MIESLIALINVFINGILFGVLLGFVALGLTLMFGILKIVNVAHGDFIILGFYISYIILNCMYTLLGIRLNPLYILPLMIFLGFILGISIYKLTLNKVVRAPELNSLLLTYALGIFLIGLLLWLFGSEPRGYEYSLPSIKFHDFILSPSYMISGIFSIVLYFIYYILLRKTYMGKIIRGASQDFEAAALVGIDVEKVLMIASGISLAFVFAASVLLLLVYPSFELFAGGWWTLLSFTIGVLGGLGNEKGTILSGILFGIILTVISYYISGAIAPTITLLILFALLIVRPEGLFGERR
jgi:branched-chain amino acid transport system permease protein